LIISVNRRYDDLRAETIEDETCPESATILSRILNKKRATISLPLVEIPGPRFGSNALGLGISAPVANPQA